MDKGKANQIIEREAKRNCTKTKILSLWISSGDHIIWGYGIVRIVGIKVDLIKRINSNRLKLWGIVKRLKMWKQINSKVQIYHQKPH